MEIKYPVLQHSICIRKEQHTQTEAVYCSTIQTAVLTRFYHWAMCIFQHYKTIINGSKPLEGKYLQQNNLKKSRFCSVIFLNLWQSMSKKRKNNVNNE